MSETIIQPVSKDGVLGPKILVKKSYMQQLWGFWFSTTRNLLAVLGLLWILSWFMG